MKKASKKQKLSFRLWKYTGCEKEAKFESWLNTIPGGSYSFEPTGDFVKFTNPEDAIIFAFKFL